MSESVFNNFINLLACIDATHICCDNCHTTNVEASDLVPAAPAPANLRPVTPPPAPATNSDDGCGSTHTTPSKSTNANGKRALVQSRPVAKHRTKEYLKDARSMLQRWRFKTVRAHYTPGPFTVDSFMPDAVIKRLASRLDIQTLDNMKASVCWAFTDRHGQDVLDTLQQLDMFELAKRKAAKQAKAAARSAVTRARLAEKRLAADILREEKKQERQRKRETKEAEKENERQLKVAERLAKAAMKPPAKRARRQPLVGTTILNLDLSGVDLSATPPLTQSSSSPRIQSSDMFLDYQVYYVCVLVQILLTSDLQLPATPLTTPVSQPRPRPRPRPIKPHFDFDTLGPLEPLRLPPQPHCARFQSKMSNISESPALVPSSLSSSIDAASSSLRSEPSLLLRPLSDELAGPVLELVVVAASSSSDSSTSKLQSSASDRKNAR